MNSGLYTQSCNDIAAAVQKKRMDERKYSDNAKQCATEQYQTQGLAAGWAATAQPEPATLSEELNTLWRTLGETRASLDYIRDVVLGASTECIGNDPKPRLSLIAHAEECREMALNLLRISLEIQSAL